MSSQSVTQVPSSAAVCCANFKQSSREVGQWLGRNVKTLLSATWEGTKTAAAFCWKTAGKAKDKAVELFGKAFVYMKAGFFIAKDYSQRNIQLFKEWARQSQNQGLMKAAGIGALITLGTLGITSLTYFCCCRPKKQALPPSEPDAPRGGVAVLPPADDGALGVLPQVDA